MDDVIYRQDAIDAVHKTVGKFIPILMVSEENALLDCVREINQLPSAQKKGNWIRVGTIENTWLVSKCSECGGQTIDNGIYCPNCGADMRETNATKEQREQLDLMRAKAQMNIKPIPELYKGEG